ncbi:unnamed protein product [Effrenium voratum]|nr:unnamed protein product [Effrenium voratum]
MFRPNLFLQTICCSQESKEKEKLAAVLSPFLQQKAKSAVVYVPTKPMARRTARRLREELVPSGLQMVVGYIDGETPPEERARQNLDFRNGEIDIMVATDAYGQGIDKPDIDLVIHWEPPFNFETYVNQIGRAGRDGRDARCILLYSNSWWGSLFSTRSWLAKELQEMDEVERKAEYASRRQLQNFATQRSRCRWSILLAYYGAHELDQGCGVCDCCQGLSVSALPDCTEPAVLLLLAVELAEESGQQALDLACGRILLSQSSKEQALLDRIAEVRRSLPTKLKLEGFLKDMLTTLHHNGFVGKDYSGLSKNRPQFHWCLTDQGRDALKWKQTIRLPDRKKAKKGLPRQINTRDVKRALQEYESVDASDEEALKEAAAHLVKVLKVGGGACAYRHLVQHVQKGDSPRLDVDYLQNDLGKYQCKLTVPGISAFVIGPPGSRKNESLLRACRKTIDHKFKVNLSEKTWVRDAVHKIRRDVPMAVYVKLSPQADALHFMAEIVLKLEQPLTFKGRSCRTWRNAVSSAIAAARFITN